MSALQIGSRYALESEIKLQLVPLLSWGFVLGGDTKGTCAGKGQPDRYRERDFFLHHAMSWGPGRAHGGDAGEHPEV